MKVNWKHKEICGIYCIKNTITNKVYIGKSLSIAKRIYSHIYEMNRKISHCSKLQNSWIKYGSSNFEYSILEKIEKSINNLNDYISDREIYWIDKFNSIKNGYNLKRDSSTECIMNEETKLKLKGRFGKLNSNFGNRWSDEKKKKLSDLKKEMFKKGLVKTASKKDLSKGGLTKRLKWKDQPYLKQKMIDKCNLTRIKYKIHQLSINGDFIKEWKDILELIDSHPEYKKHNIYAVCSGEKPSMYGFKWIKIRK